jgi:putative transposase
LLERRHHSRCPLLDRHDREIIGWVASAARISGEMIRDMMVGCVEKRCGAIRRAAVVQWVSDNGSIFAARKTLDVAAALNLAPCFTPVESPESNGVAEAFVKTFKRDYVRVNPIPGCCRCPCPDRQLDGGLQHRAPILQTGLPNT